MSSQYTVLSADGRKWYLYKQTANFEEPVTMHFLSKRDNFKSAPTVKKATQIPEDRYVYENPITHDIMLAYSDDVYALPNAHTEDL